MTPAERKRRSRAYGATLRTQSAVALSRGTGMSPQLYRDMLYVWEHGIPEWKGLFDDKGKNILGFSTQRQMIKHLSPEGQLEIIRFAKRDKNAALFAWQLMKKRIGIK